MSLKRRNAYQTYLLRYWLPQEKSSGCPTRKRFTVGEVSNEPQRWVFNSFEKLTTFLQDEL